MFVQVVAKTQYSWDFVCMSLSRGFAKYRGDVNHPGLDNQPWQRACESEWLGAGRASGALQWRQDWGMNIAMQPKICPVKLLVQNGLDTRHGRCQVTFRCCI